MAADTTTKFWTWGEVWAFLQFELDLEGAAFVSESLALSWANEAIDEIESLVHSMYQDYFLKRSPLTLVDGTEEYLLPASIYAFKIKKMVYRNGATVYPIDRLTNLDALVDAEAASAQNSRSGYYTYFIRNDTPGTPKIQLVPAAYESGQFVQVWYYRQANRLSGSGDIIDIPEFAGVVVDTLRERICFKEAAGSPRHLDAKGRVEQAKSRMLQTLKEMSADGAATIEADFSHYEGHN